MTEAKRRDDQKERMKGREREGLKSLWGLVRTTLTVNTSYKALSPSLVTSRKGVGGQQKADSSSRPLHSVMMMHQTHSR